MGITDNQEFIKHYWKYFLALCKELQEIEEYIPYDELNLQTYSYKFQKLFFSACSEIDVICKDFICKLTGEAIKAKSKKNIGAYYVAIIQKCPDFTKEKIVVKGNYEIAPWRDWGEYKSPDWWQKFNKIKHERINNIDGEMSFKHANLQNLFLSFAALYQLEMYFYCHLINEQCDSKLKIPTPQPAFFRIKDWKYNVDLIDNKYTFYVDDEENLILVGDID